MHRVIEHWKLVLTLASLIVGGTLAYAQSVSNDADHAERLAVVEEEHTMVKAKLDTLTSTGKEQTEMLRVLICYNEAEHTDKTLEECNREAQLRRLGVN